MLRSPTGVGGGLASEKKEGSLEELPHHQHLRKDADHVKFRFVTVTAWQEASKAQGDVLMTGGLGLYF
jgi:hypothetical protein